MTYENHYLDLEPSDNLIHNKPSETNLITKLIQSEGDTNFL
jgi:hypothetical protein